MHFLLNLIFALLAGWLTRQIVLEAKGSAAMAAFLGVLIGILVFLFDFAARI